ncbi:phosphoinositide phospholipase C 2-like isoform X1 [Typha angustifolia]|uniref:phosphoinositide phospholipase C 2-like isoform X1 n=1 Tax=Typha angustifolia TaxID=59011 RepID=UPI003C2CB0C7
MSVTLLLDILPLSFDRLQLMSSNYRMCLCFWRRFRQASDDPPEGIKRVFESYMEGGVMGAERLQKFLAEVQGETFSLEEAQAVIDGVKEFRLIKKKGLSVDAFFRYLFSDDNAPLSPLQVHQDMNAPLSHYYIYTGHNSYLTGNQLSSECSDVPIIKALKRGVRVIELDMWPNESNDDVLILHGRTLTMPVELNKCLLSIKEYAFVASPYPVIITLEDHLAANLQDKVAKLIKETFEEMLFIPTSEQLEEFPSPEELKNKIMISTKPPKEYLEAKSFKETDHEVKKGTEEEAWGTEVPAIKTERRTSSKAEHFNEEDTDEVEEKANLYAAPEYKRLIAITAKKKKGELSECLKIDPHKVGRLSMSEQVLEKAIHSHGIEIIRFTQRNLLRIYPRGTRITSSNYNPLVGWIHGAQMVALNMQGYGRALWLMQGMFRANGGCGYVKKPDFLMDEEHIFDPKSHLAIKKTLKVTVYMGDGWRFDFSQTHFDIYSPPDFYARVGIAGVPADSLMKRTRAIEDNWTPMWSEEFEFHLTVPELALLRIEVHEYDMSEKDDFAGQTCLPVWELRPGIRTVRLHDRKGELLPSVKLLMRFQFL